MTLLFIFGLLLIVTPTKGLRCIKYAQKGCTQFENSPAANITTGTATGDDDAFCVGRTHTLKGAADPVPLPTVHVNIRDGFHVQSSRYYALTDGLYFISFSAGTERRGMLDFSLWREKERLFDLYRSSDEANGPDTLSRDVIVDMKVLHSLKLQSNELSGLYSDTGMQTSMSGFRYTGLMLREYIFNVGRDSDATGETPILTFNHIRVNVGGAYDAKNNLFRAPVDGVYFFSFSVGARRHAKLNVELRINSRYFVDINRESTNSDGVDILSRAIMTPLKTGDTVQIFLEPSSIIYSDKGLQTSFTGFLYEPKAPKVAWSVARTTSWSSASSESPLKFDKVIVNEGGAWDASRHTIQSIIDGVFYVTFSAGVMPLRPVKMSLYKNGIQVVNLYRKSTSQNGVDLLSRSAVVTLKSGDSLSFVVDGGTSLFSNTEMQTSFSGFLLFKT